VALVDVRTGVSAGCLEFVYVLRRFDPPVSPTLKPAVCNSRGVRIRKTDEREALWDELQEATDEATLAKALDRAARHYVEDLRNKRRAADETAPRVLEELSTEVMPISVETVVGTDS
jgi:hypothetical protein